MKLTTYQAYQALARHGCYVTEACDKCGQLLAEIRFNVKGEPGEWCSRECRDGDKAYAPGICRACGVALAGKRKGARFCSDTCRKRRVKHNGQDAPNNPETRIQNKGVTVAISAPSAHSLTRPISNGTL